MNQQQMPSTMREDVFSGALSTGNEHWNIGGAYNGFQYVTGLKAALDDMGVKGITFTVYDQHSGMRWAGGRPHAFIGGQTKESFARMVEEYNRRGIQFNLVFSNLFLEEKHLGDERCNWMLEHCYRPGNGVIVGSHVLAKHIRKHFPEYRIVHSLTHFNKEPAYYYAHEDLYDVFVLPPHLNYREKVLTEMLDRLGPERLEVLVNETCFRECNIRQEHYDLISKACLEDDWDLMEQLSNGFCQRAHADRFAQLGDPKNVARVKNFTLTQDEVNGLKAFGIRNFKLSARQVPNQQYAKWMDYYIIDRIGLSTTVYVYDNYYKPAMHFARQSS